MQLNQYDVYAHFLLACREVMGTLDLEKLANDPDYKDEFFNRIALDGDDKIFEIASMVSRELDKAD